MKVLKSPYHLAMDLLNSDHLNSLFNQAVSSFENNVLSDFIPRYEWLKNDTAYHLHVDLPGLDKNNVSIAIENKQLEISGERENVSKIENAETLSSSIKYGKFSLKFSLPLEADSENLKAKFVNGTLHVEIPITAKAQKQLIAID